MFEIVALIIVFIALFNLMGRINKLEIRLREYEQDREYDAKNAAANLMRSQKSSNDDGEGKAEEDRADIKEPPSAVVAEQSVPDVKSEYAAKSVQVDRPESAAKSLRIVATQRSPADIIDAQKKKIATLVGSKRKPEVKEPYSDEASASTRSSDTINDNVIDNGGDLVSEHPKAFKISINFEEFFGRQLPIWAGGITLAIAGILIAKYASDNGILTPLVKIIFGFLFGGGLIAGAELAFRKEDWVKDPRVRQALSGAGIATLYATIYVGYNVYDIFGALSAFVGMAAVTAGAMALSIRFGAPSAVLGLIGGLATPALIGSTNPSIPMLTLYLALTIGGLAAVSRKQKWAWLGVGALLGGAGWSLLLIATSALDFATSLSIGALVILLAIGLPLVTYAGAKGSLMRLASSVVGAGQLALLVAKGGFEPMQWGMFAIIAIAGQWLAWRDQKLVIIPTISLGISIILLIIWPYPDIGIYALVAIALAIIHAGPLLKKLWGETGRMQYASELSLVSVSILGITFYHYGYNGPFGDYIWAIIALAGASIAAAAVALGWKVERNGDVGFALLSTVTTALLCVIYYFLAPSWSHPLGLGAIAIGLLFFAHKAGDYENNTGDIYMEKVASVFAILSLPILLATGFAISLEVPSLFGQPGDIISMFSILRWGGLSAVFAWFAYKAHSNIIKPSMQGIAMLLGYGFISQFIPPILLPVVMGVILIALAYASKSLSWPRLAPAIAVNVVLIALWSLEIALSWGFYAGLSLGGEPMVINADIVSVTDVFVRLLGPALLMSGALLLLRPSLSNTSLSNIGKTALMSLISVFAFIGAHILYKIGFVQFIGSDFSQYGLIQRLIWGALLMGLGWFIWMRSKGDENLAMIGRNAALASIGAGTLHGIYYSLILHNPFWADQAVGNLPIINLLIPAFILPIIGGWMISQIMPDIVKKYDRVMQIGLMIIVTVFAYATLRQFFHGSILSTSGFEPIEDISRSILAIILAIGYLLWGIKSEQRIWRLTSLILMLGAVGKVFLFDAAGLEGLLRIGSFVALGFSLIGIGWLYNRQLRNIESMDRSESLDLKE